MLKEVMVVVVVPASGAAELIVVEDQMVGLYFSSDKPKKKVFDLFSYFNFLSMDISVIIFILAFKHNYIIQ